MSTAPVVVLPHIDISSTFGTLYSVSFRGDALLTDKNLWRRRHAYRLVHRHNVSVEILFEEPTLGFSLLYLVGHRLYGLTTLQVCRCVSVAIAHPNISDEQTYLYYAYYPKDSKSTKALACIAPTIFQYYCAAHNPGTGCHHMVALPPPPQPK